jgi:hypothetical protein
MLHSRIGFRCRLVTILATPMQERILGRGSSTRDSKLNGLLVDSTVARRPAVDCAELARAFLASKATARRVHARLLLV